MDQKSLYERALFLEPGFENIVQKATNFYELISQRDQHFVEQALKKMNENVIASPEGVRSFDKLKDGERSQTTISTRQRRWRPAERRQICRVER